MTNALRIDTLAFANRLKEAGADERLAVAIVEGLAVADISHLATKDDLREEIAGVRAEIAGVKAELVKFATKDDLDKTEAVLRTEITGLHAKIDKLMYTQIAFLVTLVFAVVGGSIAF